MLITIFLFCAMILGINLILLLLLILIGVNVSKLAGQNSDDVPPLVLNQNQNIDRPPSNLVEVPRSPQ